MNRFGIIRMASIGLFMNDEDGKLKVPDEKFSDATVGVCRIESVDEKSFSGSMVKTEDLGFDEVLKFLEEHEELEYEVLKKLIFKDASSLVVLQNGNRFVYLCKIDGEVVKVCARDEDGRLPYLQLSRSSEYEITMKNEELL